MQREFAIDFVLPLGTRQGSFGGDGAGCGGVGVDVLQAELELSVVDIDNLLSNPSVVSSWLAGSSTEKIHVLINYITTQVQTQILQHTNTQRKVPLNWWTVIIS